MAGARKLGFQLYFHAAILLGALLHGGGALSGVQIRVPEAVAAGETVKLACDYDLEEVPLYSIKWYRGDQEFYRFVPKESPPTRVFPQGIRVDSSGRWRRHPAGGERELFGRRPGVIPKSLPDAELEDSAARRGRQQLLGWQEWTKRHR